MGRKVFISVIGPTPYRKSIYERNGLHMEETRYVQIATLEYLHAENWDNAVAIIGLTEKTKQSKNWDFEGTYNEEPYWGLKQEMERHFGNIELDPCDIPNGKDEEEIMKIFSYLYKRLHDGDELYFEMTNGFRYLPMLVLVLSNYTRFLLKGIKIHSMTYGNILLPNKKDNSCPIVDLMPLVTLQDWTFAAGQYTESGNISKLIEITEENDLYKPLHTVIKDFQTCRGISIIEAQNIKTARESIHDIIAKSKEIVKPIIQEIEKDLSIFDTNLNIKNGYYAAMWCCENGLYQQAVTLLIETIISDVLIKESEDWKRRKNRDIASSSFNIINENIPPKKWRYLEDEGTSKRKREEEMYNKMVNSVRLRDLLDLMISIKEIRDDIDHAGMRQNAEISGNIVSKIKKLFEKIKTENYVN